LAQRLTFCNQKADWQDLHCGPLPSSSISVEQEQTGPRSRLRSSSLRPPPSRSGTSTGDL